MGFKLNLEIQKPKKMRQVEMHNTPCHTKSFASFQ